MAVERVLPGVDVEPVLVVGAGPVGQTAALLLHRWGMPVRLLDARPTRDTAGSKAICQAQDVLDVWDTCGAGRSIAAEGLAWRTARTFYGEQEIAHWEFVDRGRSPFPACVNISQTRTEQLLDDQLAAAEVRTEWNTSIAGLYQHDCGVVATTAEGRALSGSYAVIAAGARGDDLRAALGVRFDGQSFDDRFVICDIRADLPGWEHERRFYFDPAWNPGRQVLLHPCPDSTYRIDWQVPPDFDLDACAADGTLDRMIRRIIGVRAYEVVWRSIYRFQTRATDRMRIGRVLLAGDVAHLVAPFGARGLNSGVGDAENAAWKLAFHARGWGGERLLESYHHERHAAALENVAVTSATMRFLVPPDEQAASDRRRLLEASRDDPAAGLAIDSGRFFEPYWYVESPLTLADPARPFAGRPEKGATPPPAPGILLPDLPLTAGGRSRQLARRGVLLLAGDEVDLAAVAGEARSVAGCPVAAGRSAELFDAAAQAALGIGADEVWVVRPDAYVAAIARPPEPNAVAAAVRTALGLHDKEGSRALLPPNG